MVNEILNKLDENLKKSIEHLKNEYRNIQTGRANPAMIENLKVEVYGQTMLIKALGSISTPEAQQLLITPFDISTISAIDKAIRESGLGFNPMNEGRTLRINIPPMTEEKRKNFVKLCHTKSEEAKISIRQARQDIKNEIESLEKSKQISEDEMKSGEKKMQEKVDKANDEVLTITKEKETDIMKV